MIQYQKLYSSTTNQTCLESLAKNESDFMLTDIQVKEDRRELVDYLWALPSIKGEFLFRRDSAIAVQDVFQER